MKTSDPPIPGVVTRCAAPLLVWMIFAATATGQIAGCPDPLAQNFSPAAEINDGSCIYAPASVMPQWSQELPATLKESSGLVLSNGLLWSHNDDQDIFLYALDTLDGNLVTECPITGTVNTEWEDIAREGEWIYLGDFGNNASGNRKDLHILRVRASTLCSASPEVDTLWFHYEDQTDFSALPGNTTDFDCEALIAGKDSLFLFTKQWTSHGTSVYRLPKVPGNHTAILRESWAVDGLVTGADWLEEGRVLVLCGYSPQLQPFLVLLYDFDFASFFSGNKRKLGLALPFHQVEGLATVDGRTWFASNERFVQGIQVSPKLHRLDLNAFLGAFLDGPGTAWAEPSTPEGWTCLVRTDGIECQGREGERFVLTDLAGREVLTATVSGGSAFLPKNQLPAGIYLVCSPDRVIRVIVR